MRRTGTAIFALSCASALCYGQTGSATFTYGAAGVSALSFNGVPYLSSGRLAVNAVNFLSAGGSLSSGSTTSQYSYDAANARTTLTFSWGTVVAAYGATGNKFSFRITITNSSSQTLQSISLQPLTLQFPSVPLEFDGNDPIWAMNDGNPTAIRMTAGPNTLVFANDDASQPLLAGFPGPTNRPANTVFPIRAETTGDTLVPSFVPLINRPIAPGASDTWPLSIRFGPAATPTKALVADVYQSFIKARPYRLNWPDRRPIGQLVMATSAAGYPNNPRGWFLDRFLDTTTPQGVAAFQARLLSWAAEAVTVLKSMNAQGMVTWDIEGEQYPQSTTYIGDPALVETLAPEMAGVVDKYFQMFTQAGLRVGVCLRPQQLVFPPGGGAPTQTTVADPTQLLLSKIAYAKQRWGATLFYIDSNGDPNYPMSAKFFEAVAAQYPDVLMMTEHQTDAYYAFSIPYDELKGGVTGTPQSVLDIYPSAATAIYTPDGPIAQSSATLQASVKRGDILIFRGWYPDPQNQQVLGLYPPNGTAPPLPVITSPPNGAMVTGAVTLTASVSAPGSVAGVQYLVDGANVGSPIASAPYSYTLDTSAMSAGQHSIEAVATDPAGDPGFTTINVSSAGQSSNPPPSVSITTPANGATVSGKVTISATATAVNPIASAQLSVDGSSLGTLMGSPYQYVWDTSTVANGAHTIGILVTDTAGQTGQAAAVVTVTNAPPAKPTITFAAPSDQGVVTGAVTVSTKPQGTGALSVKILVDGSPLGNLAGAPYSLSWNTLLSANGSHVLNATVTDQAGNTGMASITVTVKNNPPPTVSISSPVNGATISGKFTISAAVAGVNPIVSAQLSVDGASLGTLTGPAYQFVWDTSTVANGSHAIGIVVTDTAGNSGRATASVTVANIPPPPAPTITFTSPAANGIVAGTTTVSTNPQGAGTLSVKLSVDGSVLGSVTAAPYSLNWNTLLSADGSHVLNAIVTDSLGHTGTASIGVTVRNHAITDTTPPTIQLLSPQNNATISGLTSLSATAGDNVAVARVVFLVDGVSVGVATNSPYTVQLDSTGMTGGLHYVSAQAFDAAGNQASTNNSVSVANSQAPACSASGIRAFVGCYYSDAALGTPVLSRLDQELNFDWGTGSPGPGVPSSVFSATWRGSFNFDGGNYSFNAVANGGYRLYVDGQLIQDLWIQNSSSNLQIKSAVAAGSHSVMVQYHTGTGNEMKLSWSRL